MIEHVVDYAEATLTQCRENKIEHRIDPGAFLDERIDARAGIRQAVKAGRQQHRPVGLERSQQTQGPIVEQRDLDRPQGAGALLPFLERAKRANQLGAALILGGTWLM